MSIFYLFIVTLFAKLGLYIPVYTLYIPLYTCFVNQQHIDKLSRRIQIYLYSIKILSWKQWLIKETHLVFAQRNSDQLTKHYCIHICTSQEFHFYRLSTNDRYQSILVKQKEINEQISFLSPCYSSLFLAIQISSRALLPSPLPPLPRN